MKRLLIIFHSQSGNTKRLANAVLMGAQQQEQEVETVMKGAFDANIDDLLSHSAHKLEETTTDDHVSR